jgi:AAA domain/Bifunctional DNA primase/polymerase, N-terminal/Primase C terminal 1 (PriCT-1)
MSAASVAAEPSQAPTRSRYDVAVELVGEYGVSVFPCNPDKSPRTRNGFKAASTDLEKVDAWFLDSDALIGVPTGGRFFVVDVDPAGADWYTANAHRLNCGCIHNTRRGWHLLYATPAGVEIKNSAGQIAPGVDVRGMGGYAIWWPGEGLPATGSIDDIGPAPDWLLDAITAKPNGKASQHEHNGHQHTNQLLADDGQTIAEGGRNHWLTQRAGILWNACTGSAALRAALHAENQAHCNPPLEHGEVESIVQSAVRNFEKHTVADPAPAAGPLLKFVDVTNVIRQPSPPPRSVWQGYLPRNEVTLLGAHGGTGKSTLALQLAVATGTGRPLFDIPVEQGAALFVSLEDGAAIVRHRLARICRLWNVDTDALNENLTVVDGTERPELFTAETRLAGRTTPAYAELRELALTLGAGLIVIDNASDAFAGDEIQRLQVRQFVKSLALVARATDAAVLLLAHVSKLTSRAGSDAEAYSGSTAWHNSCRSRLFLSRTGDLLTLDHQKSNHGKLRDKLSLVWPEDGLLELAGPESGACAGAQSLLDKADTQALLALIAEYTERGERVSPIPTARTNARSLLSAEPSYPKRRSGEIFTLLRHAERDGYIERATYRSTDRKTRDCWSVTATGRAWAGLCAPSAPSALCTDEAAQTAGQKGAPSAPSSARGCGGKRAHNEVAA